jgi:hypothetical protein
MEVKINRKQEELIPYEPVLAVTKIGSCELGYLDDENLFKTSTLRWNRKDILAFVSVSEIETEFNHIFREYVNKK